MTPQEVADAYAEQGYDFIAFTDHDHFWRPGQEEMYAKVRTDLLLFVGVELTVFERGYLHVNRIRGEKEELHVLCHLPAYDLTLPQALERIEALRRRMPLDAVEITSKGFPAASFDVPAIRYPRIASDDAHERIGIGRAWVEVDCAREPDAILREVREGRSWNCYARGVGP